LNAISIINIFKTYLNIFQGIIGVQAILHGFPGLLAFVVGIAGIVYLPDSDKTLWLELDPRSPSFFPLLVSSALIFIGFVLAVEAIRTERAAPSGLNTSRTVWGVAVFLVYWICIEPLGFVVSSSLAILAIGALLRARCLVCLVLVAAIFPWALASLFWKVANIMLPRGLFFS